MDSKQLFSTKAQAYAQARPSYPAEMINYLVSRAHLNSESLVADIGGGTGLSAKPFLEKGIPVVLIEPNDEMRLGAQSFLSSFSSVSFSENSGEDTGLETASVDLIFCGQSFHWLDPEKARVEFRRILKPNGIAALAWNTRRYDDDVQKAFDGISDEFGGERYQKLMHDDMVQDFSYFFTPESYQEIHFENEQLLNLESLSNLIFSRSYIPDPGTATGEKVQERINDMFATYSEGELVQFRYMTKLFLGQI